MVENLKTKIERLERKRKHYLDLLRERRKLAEETEKTIVRLENDIQKTYFQLGRQ